MIMRKNSNITKFKKKPTFNIGVVIFLVIFIYVMISVVLYMTSKKTVIYDVDEGSLSMDGTFTGLILRDETIYYSTNSGYVDYFLKSRHKAALKTLICTIDETGRVSELINTPDNGQLSNECVDDIRNELLSLQYNYSDNNFSYIYDVSDNIYKRIFETQAEKTIANLDEYIASTDNATFFHKEFAPKTGIISYIVDKYTDFNEYSLTTSDFNTEEYTQNNLLSSTIINQGDAMYKIINDETWYIYILLNEAQYNLFRDKTSVSISVPDTDIRCTADFSVRAEGNSYIGKIKMTKYMVNFADQRYIKIDMSNNAPKGLKIPVSSVFRRNAYALPKEFYTSTGVYIVQKYKENGELTFVSVEPTILFADEQNYYVSMEDFKAGDILCKEDSSEIFVVGILKELDGVYCVNRGYAAFKTVVIIDSNDEYYIVNSRTEYGLSRYDHIVLDYTTINDSELTQ